MNFKALVCLKAKLFSVSRTLKAERKFGCASEACKLKIPYRTAEIVLHTVSESKGNYVFTLFQLVRKVIAVIVQKVVRV